MQPRFEGAVGQDEVTDGWDLRGQVSKRRSDPQHGKMTTCRPNKAERYSRTKLLMFHVISRMAWVRDAVSNHCRATMGG